jgi:dUTP pyrophosphatase
MEQPIPTFMFAVQEDLIKKYPKINFLPSKAHFTDTGWDVRSSENITLRAGQYAKISLGFRVLAPEGYWLELRPRSSSFTKKQLHFLYGVIDETYEGLCIAALQYLPDINAMGKDLKIEVGEAIGQIIPIRRQEIEIQNISNELYDQLTSQRKGSRGTDGFGSSSK